MNFAKLKRALGVRLAGAALLSLSCFCLQTQAAPAEPYTWDNVGIGGGGFVSGLITSKNEPDLLYARTDVGGAYRWNPLAGR